MENNYFDYNMLQNWVHVEDPRPVIPKFNKDDMFKRMLYHAERRGYKLELPAEHKLLR